MLYGLPFYQGKINPELFEKEKIIGTIKDNFLKQKQPSIMTAVSIF